VGIAFVIGAFAIGNFVGLATNIYWIEHNSPPERTGVEVGYDLLTMVRNWGIGGMTVFLFAIIIFAIGFFAGFRYFSRLSSIK
jgi:hypothetical protein